MWDMTAQKMCFKSLFEIVSGHLSSEIGDRLFQIFGPAELKDPSFARLV